MKALPSIVICGLLTVGAGCDPTITPGQAGVGEVGAPCGVAEDCVEVSAPMCLAMGAAGYCTSDCASLGQFSCPTGSVCEQLGDQAILCMDGCCGAADCRDGFRCARRPEIDIYQDLAICPEPGICVLSCRSDASCTQGQVCDAASGQCVARVGVNSGVGAACGSGEQCNSGTCLEAYPGGYCTGQCGTLLDACEPGSECFSWRDGAATCMARCDTAAQCRPGYRCEVQAEEDNGASVRAFCVPRCDAFGSCPDGTTCDPVGGACFAGAVAAGPVGAFCDGDAGCVSGDCDASWPNGYCTASCGSCTAGSTCVDGRCLATCGTANDCRYRYACIEGACVPGCTADAECATGRVCDTSTGACVEVAVGGAIQEFAAQNIQVSDSGSVDVTFQVPAGALSVVLHVEDNQQTLMSVLELTGPGGTTLYDIQSPATSRLTFLPTEGTFTGMFPNGPNINLVPGTYRVSFLRETGNADADVRIFGKVSAGFPGQQALSLAFYFVGGPSGLTAATAPGDARFQQALGEVRTIYGALGIETGTPTYHDLPAGALSVIDTVDGAGSELSQLFRQGTREDTLQFYFVDEILGGDDGYVILGIAGGIPGPPGLARGPHSGVAVTVRDAIDKPSLLGQVMAHEGAHYLGLFHTSEATGTNHDPLPDTAQCASSRDSNWDGYISPDECGGLGADNFMFWAATGTARGTSPEQGRVLRRNPLTR